MHAHKAAVIALVPHRSWLRTLPDGTRFQEVDKDAVPMPPTPPATSSVADTEAGGNKAGKRVKGKVGARRHEHAPACGPFSA